MASETIRTLGFFQPFGDLMLEGKTETRWVRENRKPPFPLGKYLFYSTKVPCSNVDLFQWCGPEIMHDINNAISKNPPPLNGYAIGIGELTEVKLLTADVQKTFVKFVGRKTEIIKGKEVTKVQWGLHFKNVQRIEPFEWKFGKQGVGLVPESELGKIKIHLSEVMHPMVRPCARKLINEAEKKGMKFRTTSTLRTIPEQKENLFTHYLKGE